MPQRSRDQIFLMCKNAYKIIVVKLIYFTYPCMCYTGQHTAWKKISLSANLPQQPGCAQKLVPVPRRGRSCRAVCGWNGEEWSPKDQNKPRAVFGPLLLSSLWTESTFAARFNRGKAGFFSFQNKYFPPTGRPATVLQMFPVRKKWEQIRGESVTVPREKKKKKYLSSLCVSKAVFSSNLTQLYYD